MNGGITMVLQHSTYCWENLYIGIQYYSMNFFTGLLSFYCKIYFKYWYSVDASIMGQRGISELNPGERVLVCDRCSSYITTSYGWSLCLFTWQRWCVHSGTCMLNTYNPTHKIFWLICPSHQVTGLKAMQFYSFKNVSQYNSFICK